MMNASLPLSASMARVDWRGEKTQQMKRQIMQRSSGERQYRRVSPRSMSFRNTRDECRYNSVTDGYSRSSWIQRAQSKTRSGSARVRWRELGSSPGSQSLCLVPSEVNLLLDLSVTPADLISSPVETSHAEHKLESSFQKLNLSPNYSPKSSHSVHTVSAFDLRRTESADEDIGQYRSKSAHIRGIRPSNSSEWARHRSSNRSAVLYHDPAIARSMDQFLKVNHLVYEEWSTERRRRGLEEGRLVSAKNKVIQGSRPIRKQWGGDSMDEFTSYESYNTRRRSSPRRLRFAEAPTVITDDKTNIIEATREEKSNRSDIAGPMTPLFWSDQLSRPSAKIMSQRLKNVGPKQSNLKKVQSVIVCTKPSDDYFEHYMSRIRSAKSLIDYHKAAPNNNEHAEIVEDVSGNVDDDQQYLTDSSYKKHNASDECLSWDENTLTSHPTQRAVNFVDTNDDDIVKTADNVDDDVKSEASAYLQKRKEFEMSYTLSQSSMQSSSSNISKGSRTYSSQKISKLPTDDLFIVGSPLSSSRAKNDSISKTFTSASKERVTNQFSSLQHNGKRVSGLNFHSSLSSRRKHSSQRSSDDSAELVLIRQMPSHRPTTAKSGRLHGRESASAKRVRIGVSLDQSIVSTPQFPGEDARRSVIAKFAHTTYENEALWGGALNVDESIQQDEQVSELKKDILDASTHKADSRQSLKENIKFVPSSASWTPPPSPTTTSESSPNSKSNVIHCIPTAAVNYET